MSGLIQKLLLWLVSHTSDTANTTQTQLLQENLALGAASPSEDKALVPYDVGLYDLARSRWEFGDWAALKSISYDAIADHPERAKLALFVGAGYAQSFDYEKAGLFFKAAKDWGCPKRLLVQVLASGLHNTYGRASVMAGDERRALSHLQQALTLAKPSGDLTLLQKARVQEQLAQLGVVNIDRGADSLGLETIGGTTVFGLLSQQEKEKNSFHELTQKTQSKIDSLKVGLDKALKRESENSAKQLMAFISLERYFESGELSEINTERHNWPVSPDLGLLLVSILAKNSYDLVVEFGSGFSTRLLAKTIKKMVEKAEPSNIPNFVSFDHLEKYHEKTAKMLSHAEVEHLVELRLAPLATVPVLDRGDYPFYDCISPLQQVREKSQTEIKNIFVVVDGPPGDTGPHARYPALNAVMSVFPEASIDLILDDYIRPEEKVVVDMWVQDLEKAQITFTKEEIKLKKDACLLSIRRD